jgi:redox-sensing transcriptional repressor
LKKEKISDAVIRRLPVYLRYLTRLKRLGVRTVSSKQLGRELDYNPAQIRKDLAYFGEFGRKGIGYDVDYLIKKIDQILNLDRPIKIVLVGAGNLGQALSKYNQYQKDNMKIVAIFDHSPDRIGKEISGITIQPVDELTRVIREEQIRIGIITVPDIAAQEVADKMVDAGISAILNFAPTILRVPPHVRVHNADVTAELHSLAYYVYNQEEITDQA